MDFEIRLKDGDFYYLNDDGKYVKVGSVVADWEPFELSTSYANEIIKCRYYETTGKSPCCTQDCRGCIWSETSDKQANEYVD